MSFLKTYEFFGSSNSNKDWGELLCTSIKDDYVRGVKKALKNLDNVDILDKEDGLTPLMMACHKRVKNGFEIVQLLLEHGADVNYTTNNNLTALLVSIYYNNTDVIGLLLKQDGIDIKKTFKKERINYLMLACEEKSWSAIPLLVSAGCDIKYNNKNNSNILHYYIKDCEINETSARNLKKFIKYGLDINQENDFDNSPFDILIERDWSGGVDYFLQHDGIITNDVLSRVKGEECIKYFNDYKTQLLLIMIDANLVKGLNDNEKIILHPSLVKKYDYLLDGDDLGLF